MPNPDSPTPAGDSRKALIGLLLKHQRSIYAYIFALVPKEKDAEDLLQETCLTIYEKFDEFEEGTDFVRWANRIAYWKIRQARQRFARSKVVFDETVMEAVSATAISMEREANARHEALAACLGKLNERDRRMILARYERGGSVEEAAQISGRALAATYKALGRIRQLLHDCVTYQLEFSEEGARS